MWRVRHKICKIFKSLVEFEEVGYLIFTAVRRRYTARCMPVNYYPSDLSAVPYQLFCLD